MFDTLGTTDRGVWARLGRAELDLPVKLVVADEGSTTFEPFDARDSANGRLL